MSPRQDSIGQSLIGEMIRGLARNLRRIAIFCLVVAIGSSVYALTREIRFSASAVLMVPGDQSGGALDLGQIAGNLLPGGLANLAGGGISSLGQPSGPDITVAQRVLSSRRVLEAIILEHDLIAEYGSISMERALSKVGERFSVQLTDDGFLAISAQASTRQKAAVIVRDWIDLANRELSLIVTSRARRGRIEAERALEVGMDSLESSQKAMEEFRSRTGLYFPESQSASAMSMLGDVEASLIEAEAELAGIGSTVSDRSPAYREISRRAGYLRDALQRRIGQGDTLSIFPGLDELPEIVREYETLETELQTRRIVVMTLRQELETLRVEEAKQSPTIEVVVPPSPAHLRTYPKRAAMVITFTIVAFLLAVVWLAVLTYMRRLLADEKLGPFWRQVISDAGRQLFLPRRWRQISGPDGES